MTRWSMVGIAPAFGALTESAGYPGAFGLYGLFPLVAVPLVPIALLAPGLEDRADAVSVRRAWRRAVRSGK